MLGAFGITSDIEVSDTGGPFIGRQNAGEHAERCRFSRTIGPDQAKDFAGAHVKAQVIDRKYSWKALREPLGNDHGLRLVGHFFSGVAAVARLRWASAGMPGLSS